MSIWNHAYNLIDFQAIWKTVFMIADSHYNLNLLFLIVLIKSLVFCQL